MDLYLFFSIHLPSSTKTAFPLHFALLTTRPATRTVRRIQSNVSQGRTGYAGPLPASLMYIDHCCTCTTSISVMLLCKGTKVDRYVTCWWAVVSSFSGARIVITGGRGHRDVYLWIFYSQSSLWSYLLLTKYRRAV